ncbi:MAG: VOC family protein [Promethearchaeota archaeon]
MVDFSNISGVVLYTSDMNRALNFYTKVLGFEVVKIESGFVTLQLQNMKLYLHHAENPPGEKGASLKIPQVSFKVDDINAAFQHLQQAEVKITRGIVKYNPTTYVFNFLDPDGNSLACESNTRKMG